MVLRCADKSAPTHLIFVFMGYALLNLVGRFRKTCLQQAFHSDVCFIFHIRNRVEYKAKAKPINYKPDESVMLQHFNLITSIVMQKR